MKRTHSCHDRRSPRRRRGFTLMEVLLVLVILVIITSMAVVSVRSASKKARNDSARSQIGTLERAVQMFEMSQMRYPSTSEGLTVLRHPPADATNWSGPYLDREIPLDPWGNPYQYELIDSETYRIWSMGPDGVDGTADDISNLK